MTTLIVAILLIGAPAWAWDHRRLRRASADALHQSEQPQFVLSATTHGSRATLLKSPIGSRGILAAHATRTMAGGPRRLREGGVRRLLGASVEDLGKILSDVRSELSSSGGPGDTITVFFSDIEASTSINEILGDRRWVQFLVEHERAIRRHVAMHGGRIVKAQGDGFMAVFADPAEAIRASLEIQDLRQSVRWRFRDHPVSVRIALHTGTAISRDGDYFGITVATAARIADQVEGGEVVVSDPLHEALTETADDLSFEALGNHELRGISGTHTLWRATRRTSILDTRSELSKIR